MVSADEVKIGKPAPDVFLRAAELLGVEPRKCVVIEDGRAGMKGAKVAGMKVVALVKNKQEFWPADLIVNSLMELNINNLVNWKGTVFSSRKMLMLFLLIDGVTLLIILAVLWRTGALRF